MKKTIAFIGAILIASILFTNCGNNSNETTVEFKDSLADKVPINEPLALVEGTFCFETKFKETDGTYACSLQLVIKDGKVKGVNSGEWEGCGGSSYEGYKDGDTLFLKDSFEEPDGTVVSTESLWLLQADKLYLCETIEKKGRAVLKNPAKPKFIVTYNKVNCK